MGSMLLISTSHPPALVDHGNGAAKAWQSDPSSGSGSMSVKRPVVLITGGSRGIGAAVAQLSAERGYDVAISYRSDREAAEQVAEACRARGARTVAHRGDMASQADVVALFDTAESALG